MPPKRKSSLGRIPPQTKYKQNYRKSLSLEAKEEVREATKGYVQKYGKNLTEDKKIEIQEKNIESFQIKR